VRYGYDGCFTRVRRCHGKNYSAQFISVQIIFNTWLDAQAAFLRASRLELLDRENLIDELTSMASRYRHEMQSRMGVVLTHLLKCQFQPDNKTRNWLSTLLEQRHEIKLLMASSPSLRHVATDKMEHCYQHARRMAATETGLSLAQLPQQSPYTVEQMLDEDFLP